MLTDNRTGHGLFSIFQEPIMSTLTGINSYSSAASYLFSKIDTSSKGYIEEDDLVSAFSSVTSTSDTSASDVFTQLDSDSDGKVTESEFSSALQALAETLDTQFNQARMDGAMPPPPPPPSGSTDDSGFTEDELTSQLEEIGDTDSARSTLISTILENFSAADTNSDGKVSNSEAITYAETSSASTTTESATETTATDTSTTTTASSASTGFTVEELTSQLEEIGSTDTARSSLISSIIENFDTADTNQDGTVSNSEAMAYAKANDITPTASNNSASSESGSDSGNTDVSDAQIYQKIMDLMRAYGSQSTGDSFQTSLKSVISTLA